MKISVRNFNVPRERVFTDYRACLEKPIAATFAEADGMIAAQRATGKLLAINWPIRWSQCYIAAKRVIDKGAIGEVLNVHHYGENRGRLFHRADKVEQTPTAEEKAARRL